MYINELKSDSKENSYLTATFSYNELRDAANTCFYALKFLKDNPGYVPGDSIEAINKTNAAMSFLFDMIKHGNIQKSTVLKIYNNIDERKKGDK